MPEMHLRQPQFTYSACGPFTKGKKRLKNLKKHEIRYIYIYIYIHIYIYIYQNQLDKACFQHDMVYGDFKDLNWKAAADKVLHDKALAWTYFNGL